jgi:hypothetical protein
MKQKIQLFLLFIAAIVIMEGCQKDIGTIKELGKFGKHTNVGKYNDILSNSVVIEWSNVAFEAAGGTAEGHPVLASRIEAMMHIAIHDALNAIVPVYEQYSYHQQNAVA